LRLAAISPVWLRLSMLVPMLSISVLVL